MAEAYEGQPRFTGPAHCKHLNLSRSRHLEADMWRMVLHQLSQRSTRSLMLLALVLVAASGSIGYAAAVRLVGFGMGC